MSQSKFPTVLFEPNGKPRVCDNQAQLEKAKLEGCLVKYVHQSFPKMLYGSKGQTVIVHNEIEMKDASDKGFGEDFVALPEPQAEAKVAAIADTGLVKALFEDNMQLRKNIEALEMFNEEISEKFNSKFAEIEKRLAAAEKKPQPKPAAAQA